MSELQQLTENSFVNGNKLKAQELNTIVHAINQIVSYIRNNESDWTPDDSQQYGDKVSVTSVEFNQQDGTLIATLNINGESIKIYAPKQNNITADDIISISPTYNSGTEIAAVRNQNGQKINAIYIPNTTITSLTPTLQEGVEIAKYKTAGNPQEKSLLIPSGVVDLQTYSNNTGKAIAKFKLIGDTDYTVIHAPENDNEGNSCTLEVTDNKYNENTGVIWAKIRFNGQDYPIYGPQEGNGGGSSGGNEGGGSSGGNEGGNEGNEPGGGNSGNYEYAPYLFRASRMTKAGENSNILSYTGDVINPTSETKLVVETLLGAGGSSDDVNEWFVYGMNNSQPNIANSAGVILFNTTDISQPLQSIRTWFGNIDFYNQQNQQNPPGKYLGNNYIFDCRTEVYDTNYGVQCYMSNQNGWLIYGDNINVIIPTKVPTKYQIYNDPDTYGGTFIDKENYLLPNLKNVTYSGTEKPIIESSYVAGSSADDISINNAVLIRSVFKYGGSNCIVDENSKWEILHSYIDPGAKIDTYNVNMGLDKYYKLKLSGNRNNSWQDSGIDTFTRVQHKAIVAQHDFLLGLIIGVIRDDESHTNWNKLKHKSSTPGTDDAAEVINNCLLNDYDPRMRYIWQIRNKASFQSVLQQCMRDLSFGTNQDLQITVYQKQGKGTPGEFKRVKIKDAVVDCVAEHLLEFLGPEMPWESSLSDPNNPDWGVSVSLDNNMLSTGFEIYNGVYAGQGYDAFLDWWDKKLREDFEGDTNNIHDKIIFNGRKWRECDPKGADSRKLIKSIVQGSDGTKSAIRKGPNYDPDSQIPTTKEVLKNIISRGLGGDNATGLINYDHALRAHYKQVSIGEWGGKNGIAAKTQTPDTEWTIEKYRRFVYYKVDDEHYQYVYTCAKDNQIKFFIFNDPQSAGEGVYSKGKISDTWKNSIENWYSSGNITYISPEQLRNNGYLKRFHYWDCDYDNTFFIEDEWKPVLINGKEVFRVQKFTDPYNQTITSNKMLTNSYTYCIDNTYSNNGYADLDSELQDASTKHWVDIFGQGPIASGGISFSTQNVIYGYIIEKPNDEVSVGTLSIQNYQEYATYVEVTSAAYSWAQLLARSGVHFSTKPLVDEIGAYQNLNLKLQQLSLQFYEEQTEQEQQRLEPIKTQLFGQLQDIYFGHNDKYLFNTFRESAKEEDYDIMTRLSKAYVTKDWLSWYDLKELYFVEGPCNEGQGGWQQSTETRIIDMPGMNLRKNDILVVLRNTQSTNNHIVGDIWIDNANGNFGSSNHTTLSWGTESDPFSELSLDAIGMEKFDLGPYVTIEDQEKITIPDGMPDAGSTYGRFGGQFKLGAIKSDADHVISKLILNTLYAYSYYQDFNMIYGTSKINVRGHQLDRLDNLPSLY